MFSETTFRLIMEELIPNENILHNRKHKPDPKSKAREHLRVFLCWARRGARVGFNTRTLISGNDPIINCKLEGAVLQTRASIHNAENSLAVVALKLIAKEKT